MVSGYERDYPYDRVINAGALDYIKKPFTKKEFNNKLLRILVERRLGLENKALLKKQANMNKRLSTLIDVANDLASELNFDRLFPLIIKKVTDIMEAERTSLYIIDWGKQELWTKVAEGVDQIRLRIGQGISGRVAKSGQIMNVVDAWELPYFDRDFDNKNNFRSKSILCIPIKNNSGEMIGVLQVINKKGKDRFDEDDETLSLCLVSQVGIALDNSLLHEELRISFEASVRTLSAVVDEKHHLTAGHSQRVTEYSLMIAKEMGLNEKEIEMLKYSALLHDIGKIGIRDEILLKNGSFSPEEREEMNSHAVKTKNILNNFHFPRALRYVPEIATHHHEKVNGQGYPEGLTGNQMHIGSKIIAVADVFDAITSRRDYPKYTSEETLKSNDPMPISKAVKILEEGVEEHFDSDVVAAFLRCLPKALMRFRNSHFPPEYVDDIIRQTCPELLTNTPGDYQSFQDKMLNSA